MGVFTTQYSLAQDLYDRKRRALELYDQGAATDAMSVSRLLGISRTWPSLKPGAALALAQSGLDAYSPETRTAARLAMKQSVNEGQWKKSLAKQPDIDRQAPADDKKKSGLDDLSAEQLIALQTRLYRDQSRLLDGKMKDTAFQRKWGLNGEDGSAMAALGRAITYQLGQRDPDKVESLIREQDPNPHTRYPDVKAYRSALKRANATSDIAESMKAVDESLPMRALRTVTREAGVVANTGLQVVQGSIRNLAAGGTITSNPEGVDIVSQTDLGQQLTRGLSTGDGYLPDPQAPAGQAALSAQRAAAPTIGGHAFSLGRGYANQFFEPDTLPFDTLSGVVDAGVAMKADPASSILSTIGDVRQGAKVFAPEVNGVRSATGLYPTTSRLTLHQPTKAEYMAGGSYSKTRDAIMEEANGNASTMFRRLNSNPASPTYPAFGIDGQPLVVELADASRARDGVAFDTALNKATEVQTRLPGGFSYKFRKGTDARAFASMPRGTLPDLMDKNTNWKVLDDFMRGANIPMGERDIVLDKYLRSNDPLNAIDTVSEAMAQTLVHRYGIDPDVARARTSFFSEANRTSRLYDLDQATGLERIRPGIGIAGESHPISAPSLSSEGLNSPLQIPDLRTIRRMASDFNFITDTAPWHVTQTALRAPTMLWMPLQILTARMAVRDFAETQANMAGRGMISAFTNPIQWIGTMMGANMDKRWETWLEKIPGLHPKYMLDGEGYNVISDSEDLLMHSVQAFTDPDVLVTRGYRSVPMTHPQAAEGLAEQLGRMHYDPVMKGVAEASDPVAAKNWFWEGPGKELRLSRAPITKAEDEYNMGKLASGKLTSYDPIGDIAGDRAAADRYIDSVMYPRLLDMTGGGHPELMDAVRTGQLNGRPIYNVYQAHGGEDLSTISQHAERYARELINQGIGPKNGVPAREVLQRSGTDIARYSQRIKSAVDWAFLHIADLPDRVLNRNQAWQQLKWEDLTRNAPYLTPEDLATLRANARASNISKPQMAALDRVVTDTSEARRLTLPQINKLARLNTAHNAAAIVHDLKSRSQFFDMVKFLIPFGDAFRLVAARVAKLIRVEPQTLRRLQQGIQEARQPGSSTINQLLGDPIPDGQGFSHTDPNTGDDVFTFPGSAELTNGLLTAGGPLFGTTGVKIPLSGNVSGFNMLADGYPGFGGPMVSLAGKWLLPDTPTGNAIKEVIFPYGGGDSLGVAADLGSLAIPTWLLKVAQGPPDERAFASRVHAAMNALYATGDYDNTQADLARLAKDAKRDARWLYIIQGAAQFVTPGAPNPDYYATDKKGHLAAVDVVAKKYHDMQEKKGPDAALQWLVDTWGTRNIFLTQGSSVPFAYALPMTDKAKAWVDDHPATKSKYPLVYGLFAPPGNDKNFSYDAYLDQFTEGDRRPLSAEEQIAQAENRLGFMAYNKKKADVLKANGGKAFTKDQQAWFSDYRDYLKEQFPGFDTFLANPYDSRKKRDDAVAQLIKAAKDPEITSTDAGRGLAMYLDFRQRAIDGAKKAGLASPFSAKKARGAREWLRQAADYVIEQHPNFGSIWDQVLSHELIQQEVK